MNAAAFPLVLIMIALGFFVGSGIWDVAGDIKDTLRHQKWIKAEKIREDQQRAEREKKKKAWKIAEDFAQYLDRDEFLFHGSIGNADIALAWRRLNPPISLVKPTKEVLPEPESKRQSITEVAAAVEEANKDNELEDLRLRVKKLMAVNKEQASVRQGYERMVDNIRKEKQELLNHNADLRSRNEDLLLSAQRLIRREQLDQMALANMEQDSKKAFSRDDIALLAMLSTSTMNGTLILPSGREMTSEEFYEYQMGATERIKERYGW